MDLITNDLWMQKAIAFISRARAEMWGKHNSEIMAFIYTYGLKNRTVEINLLGWNRRNKNRSGAGWGLAPAESGETIIFPEGIVVPFVVDKSLRKLTIVRHMDDTGNNTYVVPGSLPVSMTYGDISAPVKLVTENILDALILVQEFIQDGNMPEVAVIIPHDPGKTADDYAASFLARSEKVVFCSDSPENPFEKWAGDFKNGLFMEYKDRRELSGQILGSGLLTR